MNISEHQVGKIKKINHRSSNEKKGGTLRTSHEKNRQGVMQGHMGKIDRVS